MHSFEDSGGCFQKLPLLPFRRICDLLTPGEKKLLRQVSPWFFNRLSCEYRSLFETYSIHNIGSWYSSNADIAEVLGIAMDRPYGIDIKLKLTFQADANATIRKELLKNHRTAIISLDTRTKRSHDLFLLHPDWEFTQLESLTLHILFEKDSREDKSLYEGLLTRYSDKLKKFKIFQYVGSTNTLTIPVLPQLRSLSLYSVNRSEALALLHASKDTLVDLVITAVKLPDPSELRDLKLPNLKNLDLSTVDSSVALSLLKSNMQTITKLSLCKVKLVGDEIRNILMSNLSSLQLTNVNSAAAVALITSHSDNIIDLTVDYEDPTGLDIGNVELPNLKQLHMQWLDRSDAFVLIRAGWATLIELGIEDVEINKEDLEELYIPNLQTLNLTHSDEFYDYSRFSNYVYIQKE